MHERAQDYDTDPLTPIGPTRRIEPTSPPRMPWHRCPLWRRRGHRRRPPPSRQDQARLKMKQSHDLQKLGLQLSELCPGPARPHRDARERPARRHRPTYRRTKSHEGRRRQIAVRGQADAQRGRCAPLREAVAAAALGSAKETLLLHEAERWRAELVADDDALTRWQQADPDTDTQQLRSLVRRRPPRHAGAGCRPAPAAQPCAICSSSSSPDLSGPARRPP